jgi:predicted ester cyclase
MKSNKEIVFDYLKSYESGKQEKLNEFLHPMHAYFPPGGVEPADLKARIAGERFFFSAFSDIRVDMEVFLSEGEKAASRISMECVHSGEYQGIPPTGRKVTIKYISIVQIKDGKILKEWAEFNIPGIIDQIS